MTKTQNDLSHDTVKLDYQSLLDVAEYALHNTINVLIITASSMQKDLIYKKASGTALCIQAQGLESTVRIMIIAAETHNTLVEGIHRSDKHLINIPSSDKGASDCSDDDDNKEN